MESSTKAPHKDIEWPPIEVRFPGRRLDFKVIAEDGTTHDAHRDLDDALYARIHADREEEWLRIVLAYEAEPRNTHHAWWYVQLHPMFYAFEDWPSSLREGLALAHEKHLIQDGWKFVEIRPHMVNPATNDISDDATLNTRLAWWIEAGPSLFQHMGGADMGIAGHDTDLDSSADTYDDAIVKIARMIYAVYGNDRRQVMQRWDDPAAPSFGQPPEA